MKKFQKISSGRKFRAISTRSPAIALAKIQFSKKKIPEALKKIVSMELLGKLAVDFLKKSRRNFLEELLDELPQAQLNDIGILKNVLKELSDKISEKIREEF